MRGAFVVLCCLAAVAAWTRPLGAEVIYHYQDQFGVTHLSDAATTSQYRPYFYFRLPQNVDKRNLPAIIVRAAKTYGLDPALITAMIEVESGFNVRAVSPKGASGLMQIMPGTAKDLGLTDTFDATKNIEAGARYMRQLLDRFADPRLALAAYNAGPANVSRHAGVPPFAETRSYIEKVQSRLGKKL